MTVLFEVSILAPLVVCILATAGADGNTMVLPAE